jgi:hypothetical protein
VRLLPQLFAASSPVILASAAAAPSRHGAFGRRNASGSRVLPPLIQTSSTCAPRSSPQRNQEEKRTTSLILRLCKNVHQVTDMTVVTVVPESYGSVACAESGGPHDLSW